MARWFGLGFWGIGRQPSLALRVRVSGKRSPRWRILKLRSFVNREAMAGTSPGRQSGEMANSERHRVPKGRQADPDKISGVPSGLCGVCCCLTMDLRPWLLHVMPSAFRSATSELAQRVRGGRGEGGPCWRCGFGCARETQPLLALRV